MIRTFICTLIFLVPGVVSAQQDTILVQELSSAWIRYEDNSLVQAFSDDGINVGGFFLLSESIDEQLLSVCGDQVDIWVNSRLLQSHLDSCSVYNLRELKTFYQSDTLYFTLSSENFSSIQATLFQLEASVEARYQLPMKKEARLQDGIWLLFFVCLLLFGALLKSLHEPTFRQLVTAGYWKGKLEADATATLSISHVLLIILAALLIGFQQVSNIYREDIDQVISMFWRSASFVLLFMLLKIVVIRAIARLFRFYRFDGAQIREYLFFLNSLLLLMLLVEWSAFWFFDYQFESQFFGPVFCIIISLLFLIWLFIRFPRSLSNRNLHIISYLCTTEILPTFVLASWLLN